MCRLRRSQPTRSDSITALSRQRSPGHGPSPPLAVHGSEGAVIDGRFAIVGGAARRGLMSVLGWSDTLQMTTPGLIERR